MSLTFATEIFPNDDGTLKLGDSDKKWKINGGGTSTQYLKGDGTWDTPAGTYSLPTASSSTKGGIKVNGNGLKVESDILKHSNSVTAKTSFVDTATTAHANGGKIKVTDIKYDANGHITGSQDREITLSQTTYTIAGLMGSTAKGSSTLPIYWTGTAFSTISSYEGNSATATKATQDGSGNVITSTYVKKAGDTLGSTAQLSRVGISSSWYNGRDKAIIRQTSYTGYNPIISMKTTNGSWEIGPYTSDILYFVYNSDTGYNSGTNTNGEYNNIVKITKTGQLYGAVWNDYAEYRKDNLEESQLQKPGRCIREIGNGSLVLTTKRLERGCEIISDTFGFAIGEDLENGYNTPIASSGRVLAYPYEPIEEFASHIGWAVCSGPNGTVSIMTEEEEERYPSRIIGTISEIPDYEEWGTGKVKVNGRIWIRIR